MIRVEINEKNCSVKTSGHAGYAARGEDIVCSAVSILLYAYAAVTVKMGTEPVTRDDGDSFEIGPSKDPEKVKAAFDTILNGLRLLEEDYGKYIRIDYK